MSEVDRVHDPASRLNGASRSLEVFGGQAVAEMNRRVEPETLLHNPVEQDQMRQIIQVETVTAEVLIYFILNAIHPVGMASEQRQGPRHQSGIRIVAGDEQG